MLIGTSSCHTSITRVHQENLEGATPMSTANIARIKGQPSVRDRVSAAEWEAPVSSRRRIATPSIRNGPI